jgi:hypothetical protein
VRTVNVGDMVRVGDRWTEMRLIINKQSKKDFTEVDEKFFWKHYEQLLDLAQALEELKYVFGDWFSVTQQIEKHRHKMERRGYIKKEPVFATQAL